MDEFYLISGALLMSAAIVMAFRTSSGGAVAAYAGAWAMRASGYAPIDSTLLLFWAIAVMIVVCIDMTRRSPVGAPRRARYFIVGGAIVGTVTAGLTFHQAGAIIGAATGAILGAAAYRGLSRQADLRRLGRWTVAIGLPAVVTMALVAISLQGILLRASLQ